MSFNFPNVLPLVGAPTFGNIVLDNACSYSGQPVLPYPYPYPYPWYPPPQAQTDPGTLAAPPPVTTAPGTVAAQPIPTAANPAAKSRFAYSKSSTAKSVQVFPGHCSKDMLAIPGADCRSLYYCPDPPQPGQKCEPVCRCEVPDPQGQRPHGRFTYRRNPDEMAPAESAYERGFAAGVKGTYSAGQGDDYDRGYGDGMRRAHAKLQRSWSYRGTYDSGYPWVTPTLHIHNYPTPGMFFDANNPSGVYVFSTPEDLAATALATGLNMAGVHTTWVTSQSEFSANLREQMRQVIEEFSDYNRSLYGVADGGGLDWRPHHADNYKALSEGGAPVRTTNRIGETLPEHASASHAPLVWIPALDLEALRERMPRIAVLSWQDGVSTTEPPPAIRARGMDAHGMNVTPARGAQAYWRGVSAG